MYLLIVLTNQQGIYYNNILAVHFSYNFWVDWADYHME